MQGNLRATLKRWRENYLLSNLLAGMARPVWFLSQGVATLLQTRIVKNGASVRLKNGKRIIVGKDAGISVASVLFWHGLDGDEPETSRTLRFFFVRSSTFVDVGANCGLYSLVAALWNPQTKVVAF